MVALRHRRPLSIERTFAVVPYAGAVAPNGQSKREGSDEGCTSLEHPLRRNQNGSMAAASAVAQQAAPTRSLSGTKSKDFPGFGNTQVKLAWHAHVLLLEWCLQSLLMLYLVLRNQA